jgi:hypothetical protein
MTEGIQEEINNCITQLDGHGYLFKNLLHIQELSIVLSYDLTHVLWTERRVIFPFIE